MPQNDFAQYPEAPPIEWLIHRVVQEPGMISLAAGLVDESKLPVEAIQKASLEVLQGNTVTQALQYASTQGLEPLRESLASYLSEADKSTYKASEFLVTNGSQQALDLICRALLKPKDIIFLESPSYYVFIHALKSYDIEVIHLECDSEGIIPSKLEQALTEIEERGASDRLRFLYSIPYAHNPRGITFTNSRKSEILDIWNHSKASSNAWILEDAAYRELIWEENVPKSYRHLDPNISNKHIYLGSFSKAFAPGLKTGYAILDEELLRVCLRIKANEDFGNSSLNQALLDVVMKKGYFKEQVQVWKELYQSKSIIMKKALEDNMPKGVSWNKCQGGFYYFLTLEGIETGKESALFKQALKNKVVYVPGEFGYFSDFDKLPKNTLRLSFGLCSEAEITEGVQRLASAIREI